MELILLQNVEKVGKKGDVVKVRDGFARNFLLARGFALASTRENKKFVAEQKVRVAKRRELERQSAVKKVEDLERLQLTLEAAAGEHDKLFGSITSEDIRKALAEKGYPAEKKQVHLKEPIRSLGKFSVVVELFPQVKATVKVEIVPKA